MLLNITWWNCFDDNWVVTIPKFLSFLASWVAITTICGVTGNDKIGIMTTLGGFKGWTTATNFFSHLKILTAKLLQILQGFTKRAVIRSSGELLQPEVVGNWNRWRINYTHFFVDGQSRNDGNHTPHFRDYGGKITHPGALSYFDDIFLKLTTFTVSPLLGNWVS